MSSSISSSDPSGAGPWRRFLGWLLGTALGGLAFVYVFVAVVDPWDMLPLSPPFARAPISTNARFSFPALARSPRFDSVIIGTSTSRMMRPAVLDGVFGARFANLAMNSASPFEQMKMLALFARTHAAPKFVMVGVDSAWCERVPPPDLARPFPPWMYDGSRWRGYANIANLFAVQEAANQFAFLIGAKRRRYGLDGYTSFLPDDGRYDRARVDAIFASWGGDVANRPPQPVTLPALPKLASGLAALPPATRTILVFMPRDAGQQGVPGSDAAGVLAACKNGVTAIAGRLPGSLVVDFDIASPITEDRNHYWDPLHYRSGIADRIMQDIGGALAGRANADFRILWPPG
jgi:hypothetical protein